MLAVSFTLFITLMVIGTPIAFAMGLSGVIGFITCSNVDISVLVQQICGDLNSFSLMACPFFLLAGELMSKGGLTNKIIDFCSALLGWIRGGLSIVTLGACMCRYLRLRCRGYQCRRVSGRPRHERERL